MRVVQDLSLLRTHALRMQKALTEMNVQLHRGISDITGTTGMRILRAIVAGERNPQVLAAMKDRRINASEGDIAAALTGDYRAEQLFILQQELQLYEIYQQPMAACDGEIERYLNDFTDPVDPSTNPPPKAINPTAIAARSQPTQFKTIPSLYQPICSVSFRNSILKQSLKQIFARQAARS